MRSSNLFDDESLRRQAWDGIEALVREAVHVPTFIVQGNGPSEHIKAVARAMAEGYRQGVGIQ